MLINKAIMFATAAHEGQTRKGAGTPYILHPLEASVIVSQIKYDEDLICAALLHDVIEDAGMERRTLEIMFNNTIAYLVASQSEDKIKSWQARKEDTLFNLKTLADDDAMIVSLADKLSNMRAISRDYSAEGEKLWERFNAGKDKQAWYYRELVDCLAPLEVYPAYREFRELVSGVFG
jgi:myo-inositol-1(or 4)-monophosphatase